MNERMHISSGEACLAPAVLGLCFLLAACRPAPDGDATANWLHHGADHSSSKYAPHGQIDRGNFSELEISWA